VEAPLLRPEWSGRPTVLVHDLPDEGLEAGLDLLRLGGRHRDRGITLRGDGTPLGQVTAAALGGGLQSMGQLADDELVEGVGGVPPFVPRVLGLRNGGDLAAGLPPALAAGAQALGLLDEAVLGQLAQ